MVIEINGLTIVVRVDGKEYVRECADIDEVFKTLAAMPD
jgi:hypothetical protein